MRTIAPQSPAGWLHQRTHLLSSLVGNPWQVMIQVTTRGVVRVGERVGDEFRQ